MCLAVKAVRARLALISAYGLHIFMSREPIGVADAKPDDPGCIPNSLMILAGLSQEDLGIAVDVDDRRNILPHPGRMIAAPDVLGNLCA